MEGLQWSKQLTELPRAHPHTAFSDVLIENLKMTGSGLKTPKNVSDAHIQAGQPHPEGCQCAAARGTPPAGTTTALTASRSHGESRKPKAEVGKTLSVPFCPTKPYLLDGLRLSGCDDGGYRCRRLHYDSLRMSRVNLLALDVLETWLGVTLQRSTGNHKSARFSKKHPLLEDTVQLPLLGIE